MSETGDWRDPDYWYCQYVALEAENRDLKAKAALADEMATILEERFQETGAMYIDPIMDWRDRYDALTPDTGSEEGFDGGL